MVSLAFLVPVSPPVSRPIKKPQSGKIREVSGKRNGKGETNLIKNMQSGKFREDSGKFSGKGCEHCKPRFSFLSIRFLYTIFLQSGPYVYGKQTSGKQEITSDIFLTDCPGVHFRGEKLTGRSRGFSLISSICFSARFQACQKTAVQEDLGSFWEGCPQEQ